MPLPKTVTSNFESTEISFMGNQSAIVDIYLDAHSIIPSQDESKSDVVTRTGQQLVDFAKAAGAKECDLVQSEIRGDDYEDPKSGKGMIRLSFKDADDFGKFQAAFGAELAQMAKAALDKSPRRAL